MLVFRLNLDELSLIFLRYQRILLIFKSELHPRFVVEKNRCAQRARLTYRPVDFKMLRSKPISMPSFQPFNASSVEQVSFIATVVRMVKGKHFWHHADWLFRVAVVAGAGAPKHACNIKHAWSSSSSSSSSKRSHPMGAKIQQLP